MVVGIGTDIIEITRIEKACRSQHFLERVFTRREIEYCTAGGRLRANSLAAAFAAKEAAVKALGTGFAGFWPSDVEVFHEENGKPGLRFLGKASDRASERKIAGVHVSVSHDDTTAVAFVILEGDETR